MSSCSSDLALRSIAFVVQFCGAYVRLWCRKIKNIQT